MKEENLILKVEHMYKSFGITKALQDVSFHVRKGQVLGLIGENGSGKSTVTSIIAAIQQADSGEMYLEGEKYTPRNTTEAIAAGVCMILQEKGTFDSLTVAKNLFVGKEERFVHHGFLNNQEMIREGQKALDAIGATHIRAEMPLTALNFEDRKLVEVARAIYSNPKILVVDETTTALSRNGRDILYDIMNKMKKEGKSVIFISHDLDEIMEVCDTVTILRDGIYIDTIEKNDYQAPVLRKLMVGREVSDNYYRTDLESCKNTEVVLELKNVSCKELKNISFQLHKGEILGFGGLGDCGMHVLGNVTFGLTEPDLGKVLAGDGTNIKNSGIAMKKRLLIFPKTETRKH